MSDDAKKKTLEIIQEKPAKVKKEKSIPYRVGFHQSVLGKLNLHHREAWSVISSARKIDPVLDLCLKTLKITSGGSFISHFYDLTMEPYLKDYMTPQERECSELLKGIIPSLELPRPYASWLHNFIATNLWTSPTLWTQEWQDRNRS